MTGPLPSRRADALERMLGRIDATLASGEFGFPHYADPTTGRWTRTPNGDWSGGFWPGLLWLAAAATGEDRYRRSAETWAERLRPRSRSETAFRGFLFWYGAAIGARLHSDQVGRAVALEGALGLAGLYNHTAQLIPIGRDAEEPSPVGRGEASVSTVPGGTPLLLWAAAEIGDPSLDALAAIHTERHAQLCVRDDGSVTQSLSFDTTTGRLLRRYTHKGVHDDSTWARAQAWAMLGFAQASRWRPAFEDVAIRVSDWWLDHVPADWVAVWDFDDDDPDALRDTSATAIAAAALLKLAEQIPAGARRRRYRAAAEATVDTLLTRHLTPTEPEDPRPAGMLTDGNYDQRLGIATRHELIWGDYFLFESLCVLERHLAPHVT
jgi:unsaturated chondroitin disaccharide hydrolase